MKKSATTITNPDELNKHLQKSSPLTWIILGAVIASLVAFFTWSFCATIEIKINGTASINESVATLKVDEEDKNKIALGQKVCILDKVGEINAIEDDRITAAFFQIQDGDEYTFSIVLRQMKPIDFLWDKKQ